MKLSDLQVNAAAIEQGVWIDNIPDCGDLRIKTKGINNTAWRRLFASLIRALPKSAKREGASPDELDAINTQCLIETCLIEWENLVDDNGVPIPVSAAKEMLADPKWGRLRDAAFYAASWVADQSDESRKDEEKN
jgi:hypothetical protein